MQHSPFTPTEQAATGGFPHYRVPHSKEMGKEALGWKCAPCYLLRLDGVKAGFAGRPQTGMVNRRQWLIELTRNQLSLSLPIFFPCTLHLCVVLER